MKFNIMAFEPPNYRYLHFLYYFIELIRHGLESLGHDCIVTRNTLHSDRLTILVGGHLIRSAKDVDTIVGGGSCIVLQTEILKHDEISFFRDRANYEAVYLPLLRRARAVWEVLPDQHEMLRSSGIRSQLFRGGYHPALQRIAHKREEHKDIDFLFFGSQTPHRREQLARLADRGHRLVVAFDDAPIFRDNLISRARVALCLRTASSRDHLPWPRVCELLNNRSLVVVEKCARQEWLEDCFPWAESDAWVDLCERYLLDDSRLERTAEYADRYASRPFTDRLATIVDDSL